MMSTSVRRDRLDVLVDDLDLPIFGAQEAARVASRAAKRAAFRA
jgi:hypothetical protein